MNIAEIVVPKWYRDAKERGDSADILAKQVRLFCQEALIRKAKRNNLENHEIADDSLVKTTIEMYEYALQTANSKAT